MQGDLTSLIERVEKATGPDRELDAAIEVAMLGTTHMPDDLIYYKTTTRADHCLPGAYWRVSRSGEYLRTSEKYTSSLDAALALVEEKLPGWTRTVDATAPDLGIDVELFAPNDSIDKPYRVKGTHGLETHAILLALLRVLHSQQADRSFSPTEDNINDQ